MATKPFPDYKTYIDTQYQEDFPIYPRPSKINTMSKWTPILTSVLAGLLTISAVLDAIAGKSLPTIIVGAILAVTMIIVAIFEFQLQRDTKQMNTVVESLHNSEELLNCNPNYVMEKIFAYYRRGRFIHVSNVTTNEYNKMKSRAPKKFEKLMESRKEDGKTCEEIMGLVFSDSTILKDLVKIDEAYEKVGDKIQAKYEELLHSSETEREEFRKHNERLAKARENTRQVGVEDDAE